MTLRKKDYIKERMYKMKKLIATLLVVAFTTASLPVNAFGPTPGQLEYQNNGYSPPYNQYGSFSPTPQQEQYNDYNSYNYNQNGSFSNTPQQGWGNTNPDGFYSIPEEYCNHMGAGESIENYWYKEYNNNQHIVYMEIEKQCPYCLKILNSYTKKDYQNHSFNSSNECTKCGYNAGCNHEWTSIQTANYWYEVYDEHYHTEVYTEEEVCNYCGEILGSQQKSKIWSHQYQNGRCWTCGYVQQTISQPQYTPPVVSEPEYLEPEEEYAEEPVYAEQTQQSITASNLLPYQEALEQGRVYASTADGLHLYKRNYAPDDYRGYKDEYYHTVKTVYDNFTLPSGEVFAQKGDYLYRHSDNGGGIIAAAPSIIKACDYRINELKNTLKGASDASTRIAQYKEVKRGQRPLSSISERNKRYLAQTGSSNSYVTQVQEALRGLGYTSQTISGKLDSTTLNNIAYFQSQNGIYMTGWLDQETYDKITSMYTSYTNSQQKAARAPYVYLSDVHMEGKELVVSMQGNTNTTMLIIQIIYNGTVVDAEALYGTNSATVYLSPRESGIHYIEFFARNANNEMYTAPVQTINVQLPTIIQEVFESYAQEEIMKNELQTGLLANLVSNLILQPAANLANIVDRVMDIDRYGYYDRQQARQEIVDNFRNGAVQYLGNPGFFYVGQVCGDVLSVGAEIYLTASGVKGIVKGVNTIKGGIWLVRLQIVGTYQPVVLLVDSAGVATSSTTVLQVGIASNAMIGNIQNAVNGNYSYDNDTSIQKAIDIANQVKANNGNAPSGYKGGGKYQNIPLENGAQKLPEGVNYREYDINPYIKGQNRGAERIVIGDDGSVWYTNDHYYTFTRIQ